MLLNLGHTIGHGIEAASNFTVSHGQAVAIGMSVIARSCASKGLCSQETADRITSVLASFGLPVTTDLDAEAIYRAALSDKKRSADTVSLVIPKEIGSCEIIPVSINDLKQWINMGMQL